ncbi:MAG: hypothetical protein A2087_01100 [Spirochaetes bacterium GWD1_61_31]|nr:MAG: hypothetical protein A2Y37_06625 [Spirochaetes bacterium GWB1_60_80]OHD30457.1 MAG: hypothetical protein A2004_07955 [Spirochaetes bacterium GWC1_61_12]OHD41293.1 MAG: hypothetical protein A2087_01100 [Spirochaetes bacterium GWD1_61_31]OHD44409.1 MAG: hypothetical protein A2Y35_09850 [Spirochaetes bacterium GWE1_60_18]OHD60857.1 MAG: hypothetical protein A2Y32_11645 [Spirochaetes bacterium GWF1_60_12]
MDYLITLFQKVFGQTLVSLAHNWPFLAASILIAAGLKTFVATAKVSAFIRRFRGAGVFVATAAAVGTPFCSCGTTAVVLGMMASTMPWAPMVAFMVASPLSSPEGLLYGAGLFGWPFAIAYFMASILLGLAAGGVASYLERRGFFVGQARLAMPKAAATKRPAFQPLTRPQATMPPALARSLEVPTTCACRAENATLALPLNPLSPSDQADQARLQLFPARIGQLWREAWTVARRLLPLFISFAFIGYLINSLVPAAWISTLFGSGRAYGVPLAATIGLPLYFSSEASMPLIKGFIELGMSPGAVMAFLIAGSGTSIGAIVGALTIARWRVVGLVVLVLWLGAILAGYALNALIASGLLPGFVLG